MSKLGIHKTVVSLRLRVAICICVRLDCMLGKCKDLTQMFTYEAHLHITVFKKKIDKTTTQRQT
jgi:hypothetical protein